MTAKEAVRYVFGNGNWTTIVVSIVANLILIFGAAWTVGMKLENRITKLETRLEILVERLDFNHGSHHQ